MTSAERVSRALTGIETDCVPIIEAVVDPKIALALVPRAGSVAEACDVLDLDSVSASASFRRVAESGEEYTDEWGVRYRAGVHVVAHPVLGPIRSPGDLARWSGPDPDDPVRLSGLRDLVARYKGRRAIVFHHRAAFMWSAYLVGLDKLLEYFSLEPDFVLELFERVFAINERIIRNAVRAGADVVFLGDDYAGDTGPLFSPEMFRRLVRPYLRRAVDTIHGAGGLVVKHSDGNIWPIIADIVDTGIDGLNPLEPTAGMDLGRVKAQYGSRVCLIGNIDCGALLGSGTPREVDEAVREAILVGAPGGRFMLSSSNSIHAGVKPENFRAMIEAARRYGANGGASR